MHLTPGEEDGGGCDDEEGPVRAVVFRHGERLQRLTQPHVIGDQQPSPPRHSHTATSSGVTRGGGRGGSRPRAQLKRGAQNWVRGRKIGGRKKKIKDERLTCD